MHESDKNVLEDWTLIVSRFCVPVKVFTLTEKIESQALNFKGKLIAPMITYHGLNPFKRNSSVQCLANKISVSFKGNREWQRARDNENQFYETTTVFNGTLC